ncbi:ABC transporter ATP-binding protein [Gulosibacter macacae]|uniref:ABC transporter ATP-binding protein n=1 Tax=Gulosibacter macacae TaxID=2488791 RepID=A0A3P3W1H0_9MICO|nr:ABC transporter ATP-binding protein [Gulosibacter macacae]RRJ88357.1 ABC transporter ATP-binding protein [Gulosibacter macacae]
MRSLIRLFTFTRELTPSYIAIVIASIVTAIAALTVPFIIGGATDAIVSIVNGTVTFDAGIGTVIWFAVAFLATELVLTIVSSIGGWFGDVMSARMREILSNRYYDKLLQLPQRYFDNELTGTIVSRLDRTITEVTQFVKMFANTFFTMLITTGSVLVIAAIYAWPLALLLATVIPVYVWLTALTSKRWQVYEHEKNAEVDAARGRFSEVVGQMPVVKSYAQERSERLFFFTRFGRTVELTRGQSRHWHSMDALRRTALALVFFGIYLVIFIWTARGDFTLGVMVLLIQLMAMARQPVAMMSMIIDSSQHAIAGSKDYFAVMALEPDPREQLDNAEADEPLAIDADAPAVQFDHVDFEYEPGRPVLKDVSFELRRGERIAFVSESGGGKSTIVSLLLGFYPITDGCIRLFGQDTAHLRMAALRREIGVVFQDPSLFSGTIRENIAYARPDASDDEIIAAARRANAWEFIRKSPDRLDSIIGERGLKLSGGQKQRIAVARAMLKDAPVLVLDEATSALDTKSERLVQAGLDELMVGRTSLIIAHRLSTISQVDRIVTLRGGVVDEIGSPAELAETGGIYAELLSLQQEGTARSKKRMRDRFGIQA